MKRQPIISDGGLHLYPNGNIVGDDKLVAIDLDVEALVKRVARKHGVRSKGIIDYVLWNETGFPCFWSSQDPVKEFTQQLEEAFAIREKA